METQLLKLDPPYNVICYNDQFAMHIATLLVYKENEEVELKDGYNHKSRMDQVHCYPVVDYGDGTAIGDVWYNVEVRNCRVIAKDEPDEKTGFTEVNNFWFMDILRYLHESEYGSTLSPATMYHQLYRLNIRTRGADAYTYARVNLVIEENDELTVIYSKGEFELFYLVAYVTQNDVQRKEKFDLMVQWAVEYKELFHYETYFTTNQKEYQDIVDDLNKQFKEELIDQ